MKALRKPLSLFMAMLMCLGIFAGTGTTAFAAGETMTTYMVEFPRASDPNKAGWGHSAMNFLGGWSTGENNGFTIHTQDSFNGKVIYCIEPGVGVHSGDQFTGRGEDFWDDYPSDLNPTIPPDTIKEYIGRIMTYGWQGNASTSWMTDDPEDASKMAGAIATQLLVWETVVGERDSQFNHVDANAQGKNNIAEYISPENPIYNEIFSQYSAIESAVKRHTMLPSFFSSTADAGAYELKWDGQQYSLTLTDTNGVLGDYTFTSNITGLNFSVDGNQLTITSRQAIKGSVTVKAEKISAQRSGVVVWTDGIIGGGKQDFATYGETVSDQMVGYLNLEVKTGNMKLIKTSEDGQVAGINFTITGEGYSATKTTNEAGEIDITDLNPGVYTVTEQSIDKYEPQETQRVTIVSGQTANVNFNNKLKRGSLEVTKTSEDGLVEGMTFHLYGTSLSGQPVDDYAVTDSSGVARFENVLIGTGYVLEEVDTPIRYVVPDSQTAMAVLALLFSTVICIPLGVLSASRKGGLADKSIYLFGIICMSLPNYWIGFMLLLAFAVYLPIFSIMGADSLKDFVLPALALAIPTSAGTIRVFRSSLLDGYNSDFVLYARARGVSEWKIANMVSRFALPPLITMLAQSFGFMIAGSSMVESVFSIPGLGSMLVTALNARDTITINACVLLTAVIFVLVNFLADCLNTLLNPQSQMGGRS